MGKKAALRFEIERLRQEIGARQKAMGELYVAADFAEGFLTKLALMSQLDQEIRDKALKHSEAIRRITMRRQDYE
jgi:hypothetical protein